jgi:S-adenosylmethionine:tRNA ribosyltransferase-isomerase
MDLHIRTENLHLRATLLTLESGHARVQLAWSPEDQTLAEILEQLGHIPLPPYLRRDDEPIDREHYQTVYAQIPGSAAAPTAGLHFTEELLERLQNEGMLFADVCLHVGLDTFKPLRSTDVTAHSMHSESLSVPRHSLEQLRDFLRTQTQQWLVAIGTTSVRTLESLFWHGVRLIRTQSLWESPILELPQWEAYRLMREPLPSPADALDAILAWLDFHRLEQLQGTTQLMIVPGYRYQMCDALITNFHQPRSTLLLLIGALVGDFWRSIYEEALAHGYRFLSYGDASLLICPRNRTGHKSRQ